MSDQAAAFEILTNITSAPTNSESLQLGSDEKTVQAKGSTTAGAGAATIVVEVTNDTTWPWLTVGTISLTLSTAESTDGFAISAGWKNIRFRLSAISGTGAKVSASVGV